MTPNGIPTGRPTPDLPPAPGAAPEPERKTLRGLDPEIQAMAKIITILDALSPLTAGRVIDWLQDRHAEHAADAPVPDEYGYEIQ